MRLLRQQKTWQKLPRNDESRPRRNDMPNRHCEAAAFTASRSNPNLRLLRSLHSLAMTVKKLITQCTSCYSIRLNY